MIERDVAALRARVARLEHTVAWLEAHLGVKAPAESASGVSDRVLALVRTGDKMAAIKTLCAETGVGLAEAKQIVESLE